MITDRLAKTIEFLICEFMAHPKDVKISCVPLAKSTAMKIDVNPSEVGRVIGEKGAHFKAFEKLCLAYGHKMKKPIQLLPMIEPEDAVPERYGKFKGRDDWRRAEIKDLLTMTAKTLFRWEDAIDVTVKDMPNFVSIFTVKVARNEDPDIVTLMEDALKAIFNAIGRANGRVLFVDVVAGKASEPESRQPMSADGRFAKEIRR